jgi:hypothetical protein
MTFKDGLSTLREAESRLQEVWNSAYEKAKDEVRGNWQDPDVMRRRRERAYEIADAALKDTELSVVWKEQSNG